MTPRIYDREKAARRLRGIRSLPDLNWPALFHALGTKTRSETVELLADLIEPLPERTCRNVADPRYIDLGSPFVCSECGAAPSDAEMYFCGFDNSEHGWNYCPNCGARVVEP